MDEKLNEFLKVEHTFKCVMHSIGIVGNALMFVVYSRGSLRKLSVSTYFRAMALVCLCQNIYYLLMLEFWRDLSNTSQLLLEILAYLEFMITPIAAWLEVAASIDRFLAIVFPSRFNIIHRKFFQRAVIISISVYNVGLYAILILENLRHKKKYAGVDQVNSLKLLFKLDLVNSSAIPFAIMLVTSLATLTGVVRAHQRIKQSRARPTRSSSTASSLSQRALIRDLKFGLTIIVLNVLFFICNFVYCLQNVIDMNPFDLEHGYFFSFLIMESIISNLSNYYYSICFYVHLGVNSLVRREFVKMFSRSFLKCV